MLSLRHLTDKDHHQPRCCVLRYTNVGAFAAQRFDLITPGFDPILPARTAALYVDDAYTAAERLGLREIDTGTNVVLLEPFDLVVYDRTIICNGLRCVAPTSSPFESSLVLVSSSLFWTTTSSRSFCGDNEDSLLLPHAENNTTHSTIPAVIPTDNFSNQRRSHLILLSCNIFDSTVQHSAKRPRTAATR